MLVLSPLCSFVGFDDLQCGTGARKRGGWALLPRIALYDVGGDMVFHCILDNFSVFRGTLARGQVRVMMLDIRFLNYLQPPFASFCLSHRSDVSAAETFAATVSTQILAQDGLPI